MMSSQERRELGLRMQNAKPEERLAIREEYILKYQQTTQPPSSSH